MNVEISQRGMLHTGGEWTKGYVYIFVHFFFFFFFFFVFCPAEFGEFSLLLCLFVSFLRLVLRAGFALLGMDFVCLIDCS